MLAELEPIVRQRFSPENQWFGQLASLQALLALGRGDSAQASKLADQGVAKLNAAIKAKGEGTSLLPTVLLRRATIALGTGRPAQAAADASRALAALQAGAQPHAFSINIGEAYLALGRALQSQGKAEEARTAFHSAVDHFQHTLGPDDSRTQAVLQLADGDSHTR